MLTFCNADDIHSRIAGIGSVVEGESFPLSIKMPCRFAIMTPTGRQFGCTNDTLIFNSHNELEIKYYEPTDPETTIEEPAEPESDIVLKPSRQK